jgi:hypothetical protein
MTESAVIDLRDRANPPPDDPVNAPYGYRWDTRKREWTVKRSAGGRKAGAAWFGKMMGTEPEDMAPFEEQFEDSDPDPAHLKTPPARVRKTPPRVTKAVKDDIAASCGLVGLLILPPAVARDPYCGGALADNFEKITDALVPLLCRSSAVVGFFTDTGSDFMLWFKLAMALTPVAAAVGRHHILRTVTITEDPETGELYAVPTMDLSEFTTDDGETG